MTPAAFYCVSDERYFLGAVGLVNSLRLVGHTEPIYLLDCGLSESQRRLIAPHVELVEDQSQTPPWLLKTVAPLAHPAEVMVLIDADMIVTRPLDELIESAGKGMLVAVEHGQDRFFEQWGELLDLGPVSAKTYVSSSLIAADRELGLEILGLMGSLQDRVDFQRTYWRDNEPGYPFLYADQDVFNAIIAARVPAERLAPIGRRFEAIPPFEGLELIDLETLCCAYADGDEPYAIHHFTSKPWLERTPAGVYTRLLRRLLVGADITVAVGAESLPAHMRRGLASRGRAAADRARDWLGQRR